MNIVTFGIFTSILAGFLFWNQTVHYEEERLAVFSRLITRKINDNLSLAGNETENSSALRRNIELELHRLIRLYPPDFNAGFYSRHLEQVTFLAPHEQYKRFQGLILPAEDPGRKTWETLKPCYSLLWSPLMKTWVLKYDYPVIVHGQAIGHTFTQVTLTGVFKAYLQFELFLLLIIIFAGHCATLTCKWVSRKIQSNVNRLSDLNDGASFIFDYEEFNEVAKKLSLSDKNRLKADELRSSLAAIVESSQDAIISADLNGRVTSWNRGAERIFGYTHHEMVGEYIATLVPPQFKDESRHCLQKLIPDQESKTMETILSRKDGVLVDVFLNISPIKDTRGQVIGYSGIFQDITEWKQYEKKIYELAAM